jgi:hypothetical protein
MQAAIGEQGVPRGFSHRFDAGKIGYMLMLIVETGPVEALGARIDLTASIQIRNQGDYSRYPSA